MSPFLENLKENWQQAFLGFQPLLCRHTLSETDNIRAEEEKELLESLQRSIKDLNNAILNFESADNNELVDYYTYEIKAAQIRYQYILKIIKEKGIQLQSEDFNLLERVMPK